MCLSIGIDMSVHFPIFKFSIIYSYIILNLSQMQIVFNLKSCEERRRNKKVTDFFFLLFIYTVIRVLNTTRTERKRGTTTKLKYSFP